MTDNAPGRDGMELSEAFSIVLDLADFCTILAYSNKEREAIALIRALAVGSFGLKE